MREILESESDEKFPLGKSKVNESAKEKYLNNHLENSGFFGKNSLTSFNSIKNEGNLPKISNSMNLFTAKNQTSKKFFAEVKGKFPYY